MKNDEAYDYKQDFSIEELYEKEVVQEYLTPEEQLNDLGMSQSDFL